MEQGNSQLLTHTWIMDMAQKPRYITKKGIERKKGGTKKKTKRIKEVEEIQQ